MHPTPRTGRGRSMLLALPALLALAVGTLRADVTVDGFGRNPESARHRAMEEAQKAVRALVIERLGPDREPNLDQLEPDFLLGRHVVRPRGEPQQKDGDYLASYDVGLNESYLDEVRNVNLQGRVAARQGLMARVLAGLVVMLVVTTGTLRLEGLTAGYHTGLLRAAAALVVALAGLALWLSTLWTGG